jgi:uncharacterized protein
MAAECPASEPVEVHTSSQASARLALRTYQLLISPADGAGCNFYPSCSRYAWHAIQRHGVLRGTVMATERLQRAHTGWHYDTCEAGGRTYLHDPVGQNTW